MNGQVFHPGHDEWHGQTVVVHTKGPLTVIGRWHEVRAGQLHMHDVAVHDTGTAGEPREAWISRIKTYGIPVAHRSFALPRADVDSVVRLRDA